MQSLLDAVFALFPSTITRDQAISIAGSVVKGIGWVVATVGWQVSPSVQSTLLGPDAVTFYSGIVLAVVPMIYDWYKHSRAGAVMSANKVPGVEKIEIRQDASPEVKAIAEDDSIPKVVMVPSA